MGLAIRLSLKEELKQVELFPIEKDRQVATYHQE